MAGLMAYHEAPMLGIPWGRLVKTPSISPSPPHAISRIEMPRPEACRDAATLDFRKRWLSMNYKTERGNVDFFWLRFHALVKMLSDYQRITKRPVAASRRWTLTGAFWQWFGCAPAGVEPLEVRFAHPVRLSPDTHSQGHGRPCLQRSHPRRGFSATWSLLMVISFHAM